MCRAQHEHGGRRCGQHRTAKQNVAIRNARDRERYNRDRNPERAAAAQAEVDEILAAETLARDTAEDQPIASAGAAEALVEEIDLEEAELQLLAEEYGIDADDEELDWETAVAPAAVASAPVVEDSAIAQHPAPTEVDDDAVISSVAQLRAAVGPGTRVTIVEVGSRTDRRQPFTPGTHPELGRERTVLAPDSTNWQLDSGSPFETGAAREWSFENGLAVHETSLRRTVWRVVPSAAIGDEGVMRSAVTRSREDSLPERQAAVAVAVAEHEQQLAGSLAMAEELNPIELLAELPAQWRKRSESAWAVDDASAGAGRPGARSTATERDRAHPELLAGEVAVNTAWADRLREGLVFAERRLNSGPPVAGLDDHVEELRAAVRGLAGEGRLLDERKAAAAAA